MKPRKYLVLYWDAHKTTDSLEEAIKLKRELERKYGYYGKRAHIYKLIL